MSCDCFWLTDDQFSRLAPLLPSDTRGKPRVDDRRVICIPPSCGSETVVRLPTDCS